MTCAGIRIHVATAVLIGSKLVRVMVAPNFLLSWRSLMLTIGAHCGPTELQRKEQPEKNCEPATDIAARHC